tara:strand:+ start:15561 stop:15815 length:255 start_codon:yes stop_codon:yes gene_type:complete
MIPNYKIQDVEKELYPSYDYLELVKELYTEFKPNYKIVLAKDFKHCIVCKEIKRMEHFYKTRINTEGRRNSCKECDSKYYKTRK